MEVLVFAALTILVFVLIYIALQPATETARVKVADITIEAEVADSIPKQIKGLMFRKELSEDKGMLFIFGSNANHTVWMMNMNFPIDIIWIDSNHIIVDMAKNAPPGMYPVYKPKSKSRYVLEVSAGLADKHALKIGDTVSFSIQNLNQKEFKRS